MESGWGEEFREQGVVMLSVECEVLLFVASVSCYDLEELWDHLIYANMMKTSPTARRKQITEQRLIDYVKLTIVSNVHAHTSLSLSFNQIHHHNPLTTPP